MSCLRLPFLLSLVAAIPAQAKIVNPVTLEQIFKDQPLIFMARIAEVHPDKLRMVLIPTEKFRGELPSG